MPIREWKLRFLDIIKSVKNIQKRVLGLSFDEFENNEILAQSIFYEFIIIGEAAKNIPDEIQSNYPEIPWRMMEGMRNVMAHEYFQINIKKVWDTIENDLPLLAVQLQDLLQQLGE